MMVTEDRKGYRPVLGRNIRNNISLVNLKDFAKNGLIDNKKIIERSNEMVDMLKIKIANLNVQASTLSESDCFMQTHMTIKGN